MPAQLSTSRLLSLAIACTMGAAGCGCGNDTTRELPKIGRASLIDCGGKTLLIPPPPDMIRSDSIFPVWDRAMAASVPPGHQLLAYYSTFEDRVRIERQAPPVSDRDCLLHIREEDASRDVKRSRLDNRQDDIEEESQAVAAAIGSQLAKVISAGLTAADPEVPSADTGAAEVSSSPVTVAKAELLGWFGETGETFGYTVGVDLERGADGQTAAISLVTSTVVSAINGRLLSFQATASRDNEAGQQWAEETALVWARMAFSANPEYRGPSLLWQAAKLIVLVALITAIVRVVRWLKQIRDANAEMLQSRTKPKTGAEDQDDEDASASAPPAA